MTTVKSPYPFMVIVGAYNKEVGIKDGFAIKPKGSIKLPEGFEVDNETRSRYSQLKIISAKEKVVEKRVEKKEESAKADSDSKKLK